jgi:hypothetical protein
MNMDYTEFVSGLPLNGRISFSSAEENEEVMQRNGAFAGYQKGVPWGILATAITTTNCAWMLRARHSRLIFRKV